MKTRQEMFDNAWKGFVSQGFQPALDERGITCAYRGVDGRNCAIGWNISDEKYDPDLEDEPVHRLVVRKAAEIGYKDAKFADDLQAVHDQSVRRGGDIADKIKEGMVDFAAKWKLVLPQ